MLLLLNYSYWTVMAYCLQTQVTHATEAVFDTVLEKLR